MNTTLKDVLEVFFRYLRYVIVFSIIVVSFSLLYSFGAKKIYSSKAQVLIRLGQEQMGSMQFMNNAKNVYVTRREQELKNEEMIFLSDKVITAAAKAIIGSDANDAKTLAMTKRYLVDHLEVKSLLESDTLSLTFKFPNPVVAKKILGILIDKYIKHHIGVYENANELNFVKLKLAESRKKYDDALHRYTSFVDSYKIYDDKQIEFLITKRNSLRSDLANARAEHQYHKQKLARTLEEIQLLQPYEKYNSVEVINDRRNKLQSKLNEATLERQNLLQKYTPESRLVLDVNKEIEMLQKLIKNEPERVINSVDSRKNDTYWTTDQNVIDLKTTVAGEEGKIASLAQELKSLEDELSKNAHNFQDFTLLKKDLDLAKITYEKYYEGFLESDLNNMSKNQQVTNISLIEDPSQSFVPDWPNKKKILLFTGAFLIAGNFFLVLFLSMMNNTIANPMELERQFGVQPVATIPLEFGGEGADGDSPRKGLTKVMVELRGGAVGLEYFEKRRMEFQRFFTNLSRAGQDEKIFLIGRSRLGEGGATITFNLAAFLVHYLGKKVAFVDYLQSHVTEEATGFQAVEGMCLEKTQLAEVDCYRYVENSASWHADLKDKYSVLEKLRAEYDYIFCNITPIKDSADLVFLNLYVDRILFFVEADRTKRQVVKYNFDILIQYGFSRISFVLNKRKFYIPKFLYKYV